MKKPMPHILLVEDDPSQVAICESYLSNENYNVSSIDQGKKAIELIAQNCPDAIILDLKLPDMSGFEVLNYITKNELSCEVIVATGFGSMNTAVEAMQLGARDFISKPFNKERLLTTLKNTFDRQRLVRIVQTYKEEIDRPGYCGFIGSSLAMQSVYSIIDSAANSKATIFITGESGTGKEVCASAIHNKSDRSNGPFIAINCGAIPKDLIESELFGHVKGAFTGSVKDREGSVLSAHGGTLFLDEICEMDMALQPKLLRFLQTGTYNKVGSDKLESVDVRIVCATNKDPLEEVNSGNFREDLYYRLHVLPIFLPPLNARDADILEISQHFLAIYSKEEGKRFKHFSNEVESVFLNYDWPGNIRQLQNVIRNIVVLHNDEVVTPTMLPPPLNTVGTDSNQIRIPTTPKIHPQDVLTSNTQSPQDTIESIRSMDDIEREHIERAISICNGNIPTAAHHLGISAATIYRKKNAWKH